MRLYSQKVRTSFLWETNLAIGGYLAGPRWLNFFFYSFFDRIISCGDSLKIVSRMTCIKIRTPIELCNEKWELTTKNQRCIIKRYAQNGSRDYLLLKRKQNSTFYRTLNYRISTIRIEFTLLENPKKHFHSGHSTKKMASYFPSNILERVTIIQSTNNRDN